MDLAGCLGRLGALCDRPGAHLLLARGQITHQAQQVIAHADEAVQAGLLEAEIGQKHFLFVGRQAGDVLLKLGADGQHHGPLGVSDLLHGGQARVLGLIAGKACLVHVGRIDDLLSRKQVGLCHDALHVLVVGEAREGACGQSLAQMGMQALQDLNVGHQLFVGLGRLAHAV